MQPMYPLRGNPRLSKMALPKPRPAPVASAIEVGPGQKYESPEQVPWASLPEGSQVNIHYRAQPYASKIAISTNNLSVVGIPGPNGELPVIDAMNAIENTDASYYYGEGVAHYALITIHPGANSHGAPVRNVMIYGLAIRGAGENVPYTAHDGSASGFWRGSGAIGMWGMAKNITIQNCQVHGNDQGIFGKSYGDANGDLWNIHLFGNKIWDNGLEGSNHVHNTYIEGWYTLYAFNNYGPLKDGAGGVSLKDRSVAPIVCYNRLEGGSHILDLVDPDDGHWDMVPSPDFGPVWVVGNILVFQGTGNSLVHFGYDQNPEGSQKVLYFFDNTVVAWNSWDDGGWYYTGVLTANGGTTVYVFDNLFWLSSPDGTHPGDFYLVWSSYGPAMVYVGANLGPSFMQANDGSSAVVGWDNMVQVNDPGLQDMAAYDFRLAADSAARGQAQGLYDGTGFTFLTGAVVIEWNPETQAWQSRPSMQNLGAIE